MRLATGRQGDQARKNGGIISAAFLPLVAAIFAPLLSAESLHAADTERPQVDPSVFQLDIPAGPIQLGKGARVLTADGEGRQVVARLYFTAGNQAVVLLPDGQLQTRAAQQIQPTERPFVPQTPAEVAQELSKSGKLTGFRTKTTKRYAYIYNTSEEFAQVTLKILESMLPGLIDFAKNQKIDAVEPELPLVVVMFRTVEDYQAYRRTPAGTVAYYSVLDNRVAVVEESAIFRAGAELALRQSISTIAHEGTHQILHNIGVQQRLSVWPMWLSEGLAEYLAPTNTSKNLSWKGAGQINDLRMFELERLLQARAAENADGVLVDNTVLAARLTSTGYASAWALTHYLMQHDRAHFQRFLQETSKLGPLEGDMQVVPPGHIPGNRTEFRRQFGEDSTAIEKRLLGHLKNQKYEPPFADYSHYVGWVQSGSGRMIKREASVFLLRDDALQWISATKAQLPEALRGSAQSNVQRFNNRALAEQYSAKWIKTGK